MADQTNPLKRKKRRFVPKRDYFHSRCFQKIKDHEWEENIDSDDDDQSWLQEIETSILHDFTDVSEEEKQLILLWNDFMRSDTIIAHHKIPQMCVDFITQHAKTIHDSGISMQLTYHLVNLVEEGLIASFHLSSCMEYYYNLVGELKPSASEASKKNSGEGVSNVAL